MLPSKQRTFSKPLDIRAMHDTKTTESQNILGTKAQDIGSFTPVLLTFMHYVQMQKVCKKDVSYEYRLFWPFLATFSAKKFCVHVAQGFIVFFDFGCATLLFATFRPGKRLFHYLLCNYYNISGLYPSRAFFWAVCYTFNIYISAKHFLGQLTFCQVKLKIC